MSISWKHTLVVAAAAASPSIVAFLNNTSAWTLPTLEASLASAAMAAVAAALRSFLVPSAVAK